MTGYQPIRRIYFGEIELGPQPQTWIRKHSFASKEFVEGQVKYGEWEKDDNRPNCYIIYAITTEGIKDVTVLFKIKSLGTHVLVYHIHLLRNR